MLANDTLILGSAHRYYILIQAKLTRKKERKKETSHTAGPRDLGSIPGRVITRLKKWDLLNTQHYKVRIKGIVEQFRERSSAVPLQLSVVAIKKGAFVSPSTKVAKFTFYFYGALGVSTKVAADQDKIKRWRRVQIRKKKRKKSDT